MSTFEIIDFYNGGAQVQIPAKAGGNMTHSFTGGGGDSDGEPEEIGYEPKGNSKLADGAAYDEIKVDGQRHLLLKGGHVYDVKMGGDEHVISAEEGHITIPIPKGAHVDVDEHADGEE